MPARHRILAGLALVVLAADRTLATLHERPRRVQRAGPVRVPEGADTTSAAG